METKRPLILITNDDGIASKGIRHLASIAVKHGEVIIVAPADPPVGKIIGSYCQFASYGERG